MKKKLSVSMRKGAKIAEELGIPIGKRDIASIKDGELCLCSLGVALLPVLGVEGIRTAFDEGEEAALEDVLTNTFHKFREESTCLPKKFKAITDNPFDAPRRPYGFVWKLNDIYKKSPEEIADGLAACGL